MSKNLKTTSQLTKIRNFLLACTVLFAMLVGFGIFYERNFLAASGWDTFNIVLRSLLAAYIVGGAIVYAWLVWLVAFLAPRIPFIRGKKLLIVAVDCIICAIIVIIVKNLIHAETSLDMLIAGLLFFVAFCCVTADYLKRLL